MKLYRACRPRGEGWGGKFKWEWRGVKIEDVGEDGNNNKVDDFLGKKQGVGQRRSCRHV